MEWFPLMFDRVKAHAAKPSSISRSVGARINTSDDG
jgi:hypothetical protein